MRRLRVLGRGRSSGKEGVGGEGKGFVMVKREDETHRVIWTATSSSRSQSIPSHFYDSRYDTDNRY